MRKKGGTGSSPTAHSQFGLLHPLLTSQTMIGRSWPQCKFLIQEISDNPELSFPVLVILTEFYRGT